MAVLSGRKRYLGCVPWGIGSSLKLKPDCSFKNLSPQICSQVPTRSQDRADLCRDDVAMANSREKANLEKTKDGGGEAP